MHTKTNICAVWNFLRVNTECKICFLACCHDRFVKGDWYFFHESVYPVVCWCDQLIPERQALTSLPRCRHGLLAGSTSCTKVSFKSLFVLFWVIGNFSKLFPTRPPCVVVRHASHYFPALRSDRSGRKTPRPSVQSRSCRQSCQAIPSSSETIRTREEFHYFQLVKGVFCYLRSRCSMQYVNLCFFL